MSNRVLHLDLETYSSLDLTEVGVDNYVRSADFAVTVIAWAFDSDPVQSAQWPHTQLPPDIRTHVLAGGEIRAWNKAFEWNILTKHYHLDVPHEQMVCTMQKALAYGLPAGLAKAGRALGLLTVKDETKRLLMLQMSQPRKKGPPWHEAAFGGTDHVAITKLYELAAYCRDDVNAERAVDEVVPGLPPFEAKLSTLDAKINERGVMLDTAGVSGLGMAALHEIGLLNAECSALTSGKVTSPGSQTAKLLAWLRDESVPMPDLRKETVTQALAVAWPGPAKRVLEIRQQVARASIKKLMAMALVVSRDERARNLLQFCGAGRTFRWAGRMIQPQNLPRPEAGLQPERIIGCAAFDHAGLGLVYGDPLKAISKSLRGCFIAKPGHVLVSVDLSQIEARVLAWLANQTDVVKAFERGEDVYVLQAAKVGSANRQLGKVLVLACGFGMGGDKFEETAAGYGVVLTNTEAHGYVAGWRHANRAIVQFWYLVERAVIDSVMLPGKVMALPRGMAVKTFWGDNGYVTQIRKPNGVKLTYHNMRLEDGGLVFDGVNSKTKQWDTLRTYGGKLVENIVQSVARDIMAEAITRCRELPVMTVHDEIVWETQPVDGTGAHDAKVLQVIVDTVPAWAKGLPVASSATVSKRYGKG